MILVWIGLAVLAGWALVMGTLIWLDALRFDLPADAILPLALRGVIDPLGYWYLQRPLHFTPEERALWLAGLAERLDLTSVRAAHCPLCAAEIAVAWDVNQKGTLIAAHGPVRCPRCDFRLDACRHCQYFQPVGSQPGTAWSGRGMSWTYGRCTFYKSLQPVAAITSAEMARRLQERGYTHLRAPTPITDSYIPLDGCSAFVLADHNLPQSSMRWPGRRQALALRVMQQSLPVEVAAAAPADEPTEPPVSGEEQWLL